MPSKAAFADEMGLAAHDALLSHARASHRARLRGQLQVARVVGEDYLHQAIRNKNGAYGAWLVARRSGLVCFLTYRGHRGRRGVGGGGGETKG